MRATRSADDVARHADDVVPPRLHAADGVATIDHGARAYDDLGRAMDELAVTEQQYDEVMSAYDAAETAIEAGLEAIDAGDPAGDIEERGQLVVEVSEQLEAKLVPILGRDLEKLYAKVGRPEIFVARAKRRKLEERRATRVPPDGG